MIRRKTVMLSDISAGHLIARGGSQIGLIIWVVGVFYFFFAVNELWLASPLETRWVLILICSGRMSRPIPDSCKRMHLLG
jgi:hypothetical protein